MRLLSRALFLVFALLALFPAGLLGLPENISLTGDVRLRLRLADSGHRGELLGTYGEQIARGLSIRHRGLFELSYPLTEEMRIGGLIRVSNEDKRSIRFGPDYFSSEFGSGFFEYQRDVCNARMGYFTTSFTPLTLMRWDLKDDPEGGGGICPVCGGPGVGGSFLGETLEELGPRLGFEGLRVGVSPVDAVALESYFSRPWVGGEVYPVKNFGARLGFRRYFKSVGRFAGIDFVVVRSQDDHRSSEPDTTDPTNHLRQFSNSIYSVSWEIPIALTVPILGHLSFSGEWSLSKSKGEEGTIRWDMEGEGGIFTLEVKPIKPLMVEASYVYLSPHWDSYFRSLSYNPNRRGPRFRIEYEGERLAFAIFVKYLETIDQEPKAYPTLSARVYYELNPALDLGFATIFSGEGRLGKRLDIDFENKRTTLVGSIAFKIRRDSSINFEQRYVIHDTLEDDYRVSLTTLFVKAKIW